MTRLFGLSVAGTLTALAAAGMTALIATDFLGEAGMAALWEGVRTALARPASVIVGDGMAGFKPEKAIHFFEEVPIEGTDLKASTGAAYASVADVEAGRPLRQWCYVDVDSGQPGIHERIDLGAQVNGDAPVYTPRDSLAGADFSAHGLDADRLAIIAQTHCRFGKLDPLT